jgi:cation diffusion facilitator CzcD-associated flavoprotein CzcO
LIVPPPDHEVAVIGAGFSGLIAAIELKRLDRHSFVVLERADEIGGVWRENIYPGCACDVPASLYSFSTHPNPDWSSNYASQPEILAYLRSVCQQAGIQPHLRFGFNVEQARFDPGTALWQLSDSSGESLSVRVLIIAVGPHSRPKFPPRLDREIFAGRVLHTAHWDSGVRFSGSTVAVIGTGASAVQVIPKLAPIVSRLLVVQRSAPWVLPRWDRSHSRIEKQLLRRFPVIQRIDRALVYTIMELIGLAFVGPRIFNELMGAVVRAKLRLEVHSAKTRKMLLPDYRVGCKRLMVSDEYYPAFNYPNVELITQPFKQLTSRGFITENGSEYSVDNVIFGTGFSVADPDSFLPVIGLNDRILSQEWQAKGAQAFQGTVISGYPNMLMLLGPNSGLSHSSALHVVDSQMHYLAAYLQYLDHLGESCFLNMKESVQEGYNRNIQSRLRHSIWSSGCRSWYIDRKGRNTVIYPGLTRSFRRLLRHFDKEAFEVHPAAVAGSTGSSRSQTGAVNQITP